jgi:galactokinase
MAIDLGTTLECSSSRSIELSSDKEQGKVHITLPIGASEEFGSDWGGFVAAVVREVAPMTGFSGLVTSSLPIGSGLSSSSSLTVAVALAAGFDGPAIELIRLCQRAETNASGVPCGIMDQFAIVNGIEGAALLIDTHAETSETIALPPGIAVHAVHCGRSRRLASSAYAERRASCEAAEREIGPLRLADRAAVHGLADPTLRRRARHVVTEIERVGDAAEAMRANDPIELGRLMSESHASLRDDFEVSIAELDTTVERLCAIPGVHGARLTGAGFGGCVVAVMDESVDPIRVGGWRLRPSRGARVIDQ